MAETNLPSRVNELRRQAERARIKAAVFTGAILLEATSIALDMYDSGSDLFNIFASGLVGGFAVYRGLESISLSNQANALEAVVEQARIAHDPSQITSTSTEHPAAPDS